MPLVEVVAAPPTDPAVADRADGADDGLGQDPGPLPRTRPGFIVNRVNRPFTLEALAMLEAGDAVGRGDRRARSAPTGFPMGPFELMDLIGIDVNLAAAHGHLGAALGRPRPRFGPSPIQERLVADGPARPQDRRGLLRATTDGRAAPSAGSQSPARGLDERRPATPRSIASGSSRRSINEAYRARRRGRRDRRADIDLALRLGAGHPHGPFERAR